MLDVSKPIYRYCKKIDDAMISCGYVLECMSSRICDVPLLQELKIGFRRHSSVQPFHLLRTRALLENMRFNAFVIASVLVSYVVYGMRHGMDGNKKELGWWPKRHPLLFSLEQRKGGNFHGNAKASLNGIHRSTHSMACH